MLRTALFSPTQKTEDSHSENLVFSLRQLGEAVLAAVSNTLQNLETTNIYSSLILCVCCGFGGATLLSRVIQGPGQYSVAGLESCGGCE